MSPYRSKRIVIVGGGTAGWMTAAALSHGLPRGFSIRLVESEAIGTVGVGEATVPHIRFFNATLGLDEADFIARTKATFKLGIEFRNWGRIGDSYIHPFGAYGRSIAGIQFHQHWLRMRAEGDTSSLEEYSLPVVAARGARFDHPSPDQSSLRSTFSYAYQFDAGLYAAYLREYSEARGVVRKEGRIVEVLQRPDDGFVEAVVLESGERVEADLFIDCTGFRSLLIGDKLGAAFEDWSHWLPCDRAIALPCAKSGPTEPYTRATAQGGGWTWRIPLQHRVGNGHVYSSAFVSDEEAERDLRGQLEGAVLAEPNRLRFKAGRRSRQWDKNVVAIGLAAGFLEPLESTSIHLIQLAIGHLIELFPKNGFDPLAAAEFDRIMHLEYERVRDFIILHYCATEREDTPFWNYCRTMPLPETLASKMELFKERGVVANYRHGMFLEPSWLAVYLGQRVFPKRHDPLSLKVPSELLKKELDTLRSSYAEVARSMPSHDAFVDRMVAAAQVRA